MKNITLLGSCVLAIAVVSFLVLGSVGLRTVLGMFLVLVFPVYFILDSFVKDELEKIVFSLFLGVGLVPALIYWPATVFSLRWTVFLVAVLLGLVGFWLRRKNSKS
ncbi:MAG: hypothetical protein O2779_00620 [Nanoarchaeota archaeon]|nr:hypothetical protein [Nanoarchaeota archaeon]